MSQNAKDQLGVPGSSASPSKRKMTQQIVDEKEKEGDVYQFLEEDDDFEEFEPDAEEAQRNMEVEMVAGGELEKTLW